MKRYPQYKDSGTTVLPDIPTNWWVTRLMAVALTRTSNVDKLSDASEPTVRLCNYTDAYKNDVVTDDMAFMVATASNEQVRRFGLRPGDTVFTKDSETADDIGIPAFVATAGPDLVCGYHLAIASPKSSAIDGKYLFWVLASAPTLRQWESLATGVTRVGLRTSDIARLNICLPSRDEQGRIADFLDQETARIDTLIEKQQQLIETLSERRVAAIQRAIDHADAVILPLKRRMTVTDCKHVTAEFVESDDSYPLASIRECGGPTLDLRRAKRTTKAFFDLLREGARDPEPGDLVMTRNATVGLVARVEATTPQFALGQDVCLLRQLRPDSVDARYAQYVLRSHGTQEQFELRMVGSTFRRVNVDDIRELQTAWPPIDEQRQIADYLDEQTAKIDVLIEKAQRFIELSKERRSALITAAVTGQIDVREADAESSASEGAA